MSAAPSKLLRPLAALLLAGSLLAGPAAAATLKAEARVAGTQVTLGDLFDGLEPELAARVVGGAPTLGRSLTLDANALARIAAANGLAWRPLGGADRVSVQREAVQVDAAAVREALVQALEQSGAPAGLEVTLDNRSLVLFLPAGSDGAMRVENLAYDPARGRVTAEIVGTAGGETVLRQAVGGRAVEVLEVPVLSRRLNPGETVTDADVVWGKVARDRAGADILTDAKSLVGMVARSGINPNQPVRARDVRAATVIQKGALVTIMVRSASMTLTAQGRALTDGAAGQPIRVSNTSSNKVLEAVVAGPDLVLVEPTGMPLANPQATPAARTRAADANTTVVR